MGYVILSNGDINGNDVKNYHIFKAKIIDYHRFDATIEIEITSEIPICSNQNLSPKKLDEKYGKEFGFQNFQIKLSGDIKSFYNGNGEYKSYYYKLCKSIKFGKLEYYNSYYVDNEKELMILAANIGKDICGNCISTLYSDDDKNNKG